MARFAAGAGTTVRSSADCLSRAARFWPVRRVHPVRGRAMRSLGESWRHEISGRGRVLYERAVSGGPSEYR